MRCLPSALVEQARLELAVGPVELPHKKPQPVDRGLLLNIKLCTASLPESRKLLKSAGIPGNLIITELRHRADFSEIACKT